jgi:hypothetical protein
MLGFRKAPVSLHPRCEDGTNNDVLKPIGLLGTRDMGSTGGFLQMKRNRLLPRLFAIKFSTPVAHFKTSTFGLMPRLELGSTGELVVLGRKSSWL